MEEARTTLSKILSLESKSENRRNYLFDFLKGLAMILVLLHHSGIPFGFVILAFHMPLFFVITGYIEGDRNSYEKKSFKVFVKNKFTRLIIPYLLFEVVNLLIWIVVCYLKGESFSISDALYSIFVCINTDAYTGLCGRLWFLPCMFVSGVLFYIVKKCTGKKSVLIVIMISLFGMSYVTSNVLGFRLPFTLDSALMGTAFIILGYVAKDIITYLLRPCFKITDLILCIVCFMALYASIKNGAQMLMFINQYGNYTLSVIGAMGGVIAFFICAKWLYLLVERMHMTLFNKLVIWYGQNSLATFPVHLQIKCILLLFPINYGWLILFLAMIVLNIPVVNMINIYFPIMVGGKKN